MPRVGKHFKIHASIQNHRKMPGVYHDDALLAMTTRAGILCMERFADKTGNACLVGRRDLERVAATEPWTNAIRKLRRLVQHTTIRVTCGCPTGPLATPAERKEYALSHPAETSQRRRSGVAAASQPPPCDCAELRLEFPNFAKKQGFGLRNGSSMAPSASASASKTHIQSTVPKPDPIPDPDPIESADWDPLRQGKLSPADQKKAGEWLRSSGVWAKYDVPLDAMVTELIAHARKNDRVHEDWFAAFVTWVTTAIGMNRLRLRGEPRTNGRRYDRPPVPDSGPRLPSADEVRQRAIARGGIPDAEDRAARDAHLADFQAELRRARHTAPPPPVRTAPRDERCPRCSTPLLGKGPCEPCAVLERARAATAPDLVSRQDTNFESDVPDDAYEAQQPLHEDVSDEPPPDVLELLDQQDAEEREWEELPPWMRDKPKKPPLRRDPGRLSGKAAARMAGAGARHLG